MKPILRFPVLLLGLCGSAAALQADEPKLNVPGIAGQPAAKPATPAEPQFTEKQLLEAYGWYLGKQAGLHELFTAAQTDIIVHGIQLAGGGGAAPYDFKLIGPQLGKYMQAKSQAYTEKENASYFAKLEQNKNVVVLPDGLHYEIIKPGTGDYPKPTQVVKVNYTGTLVNGTVFDSTTRHDPPGPAEFELDHVIRGWTEGLQKINKGGEIRLYIPASLAYGDEPQSGIPPGSTLIFDVELLDFKDASAAGPGPAPAEGTQK